VQTTQDGCGGNVQSLSQRVRRIERFSLQACSNFGVEMIDRGSSGPRIIVYVLAPAVEALTPMLDASKTGDFKTILCGHSSVNLDWMNSLLMEKVNNNSLLIAHGK
jgi:hypothetical protein